MDITDLFIARYRKEYDFYREVARLASDVLQSELGTSGVRSIVTFRAKAIDRAEEKCRHRDAKRNYASVDEVYQDLVDLAGVRVALYFPGQIDLVEQAVRKRFRVEDEVRRFPDPNRTPSNGSKFSGYSAVHFRVALRESDLPEGQSRYAGVRVEVQVASVLMHAWAEVEHDLVYKPASGEVSAQELALLDQLNGLILVGEASLEQLQRAGEERVLGGDRKIENRYDLATLLLRNFPQLATADAVEGGLGRVDDLFAFLHNLGIDTPAKLAPYLATLHEDVERRPLSQQVVDALLAEDESRLEIYQSARRRPGRDSDAPEIGGDTVALGHFLTSWVRFEGLVNRVKRSDGQRPLFPNRAALARIGIFSTDELLEIDRVRNVRNMAVHGIEPFSAEELLSAADRLSPMIEKLKDHLHLHEPDPDPGGGEDNDET